MLMLDEHERNELWRHVINAVEDYAKNVNTAAHKTFSLQMYQCNLCALTHSTFRMRRGWKVFLETLEIPLEFLHADELKNRYGVSCVPLPAVFKKEGAGLELLIGADSINECQTIDELPGGVWSHGAIEELSGSEKCPSCF